MAAKFSWRTRRPMAILVLAGAIAILALCLFLRSSSNAQSQGKALASSLEGEDSRAVQAMIWPKEIAVLGMTNDQVYQVIRQVFAPEFRSLGVDFGSFRQFGGGHEWYDISHGTMEGHSITVILGLFQVKPGQYDTTLTYLYLTLDHAELDVDRRLGTHKAVQIRHQRNAKLKALGMPGLCDSRDWSVTPWPHQG